MRIVTTKDELKLAIKQKEKSILIKSKLANAIKKELKAWLLSSASLAVIMLATMTLIGWSSEAGHTFSIVIHITATLILLISLPYAFIMKRDLCSYKIISKEGGEIIMERD